MYNIILLGLTSLLTDISSEMVYPVLPAFLVATLGASPALLGVIEGIAESTASLLKVFSGYFSDRVRTRKPFAIAGYGCSTVGKLFLFLAGSWGAVLVGRVIDRFGKGVRTAPRDALIAESAHDQKRGAAFGLHRTLDTVGAVIGVTAAYYYCLRWPQNLRIIFLLSLVPAFLGVALLFLVKESKHTTPVKVSVPLFRWGALDARLKFFLLFSFVFALGNSSNAFLLLRAQNSGAGLATVILFYLVYNIVYASTAYPAAWLSDIVGRKKLLVLGYFFYAAVYLGFAHTRNPSSFWALFALYGAYMGFTEGVEKALVADIAPRELRATAIGLHATIVGVGLLPASLCAGLLWQYLGAAAPFYFGAGVAFVAGVGFWFVLGAL